MSIAFKYTSKNDNFIQIQEIFLRKKEDNFNNIT